MAAFPQQLDVKFLNTTHPCYNAYNLALAEALIEGGDQFDALKHRILYRRVADQNPQYLASRLQHAEYEDVLGGIFDYYISTTFTHPIRVVFAIEDEDKLEYYNGLNDGLNDLLMGRQRDMLAYGYGLLSVSYPETDSGAQNLAQQLTDKSLDAVITYIPIPSVEDWEITPLGDLVWIKTHTIEMARSTPFGPAEREHHTWTYISADSKVVYEAEKECTKPWDGKEFGAKTSERTIQFGLPIFECSQAERTCLLNRVKRAAISLYNKQGALNFAEFASCYPQPYYAGDKKASELCGQANEFALWVMGPNEKVGYLEASGASFSQMAASIERKQTNLMAIINAESIRMSDKDQHSASGKAKQQDRLPIESFAAMQAGRLRYALGQAIDYIIRSRGDEGLVQYKLLGLDQFSPTSIGDKIANVAAFIAMPGASTTAKQLALNDIGQLMAVGATAQERETIEAEQGALITDPAEALAGAPPAGAAASGNPAVSVAASAASASVSGSAQPDAPPIRIKAKLKKIDPQRVQQQHKVDVAFKDELVKRIGSDGYDPKFPGLVVEIPGLHADDGSIYKALDAHHRIGASKELGLDSIPAWVLSYRDWQRLTDAFPYDPKRLGSLDEHIELPDGRTYDQVRTDNSHTNGKTAVSSMPASTAASSAATSIASIGSTGS